MAAIQNTPDGLINAAAVAQPPAKATKTTEPAPAPAPDPAPKE